MRVKSRNNRRAIAKQLWSGMFTSASFCETEKTQYHTEAREREMILVLQQQTQEKGTSLRLPKLYKLHSGTVLTLLHNFLRKNKLHEVKNQLMSNTNTEFQ